MTADHGTSLTRSYSSIVGGTTATGSVRIRRSETHSKQTKLQEIKELMQRVLTLSTQAQMESAIYQREATASANMVQRLVTNNRVLSDQVSLLHSALETLLQASSCDSMLTSVADTLEKARQLREANPPPILAEVYTSNAQSSSDDQQALTNETQEVTPDKPLDTMENDYKVAACMVTSPKETATATTTPAEQNNGFMTPNRKHVSSTTASAPLALKGIEMSNAFNPLQLQSLGTTCGCNSSPGTSGKGNLQMIKKTLHFLLNFLQISTIFASFSHAHARTLQNPSICPCATTLRNNSVESSSIFTAISCYASIGLST
jgi:hypothetical protein